MTGTQLATSLRQAIGKATVGLVAPALGSIGLLLVAFPVMGQTRFSRNVSLSVGTMGFDASGTGWAPTAALRADGELGTRWLLGELGIGYAPIREQFRIHPTQLGMFEMQLQVQYPGTYLRPYLGTGFGAVSYLTQPGGRPRTNEAVSLGIGLRLPVGRRVGVRFEGRVRYWGTSSSGSGFVNSAGEVTAGLSRRF